MSFWKYRKGKVSRLPFFPFCQNRAANERGFTLVELIIVLTIASILAAVFVARFDTAHESLQFDGMIRKIAADVRYAREMALTGGQGTRVYIEQGNNRYSLRWADGVYMTNPMGGGNFVVDLGHGDFGSVQITSTAFSNGRLDFTRAGLPRNAGAQFSGKLNLITLNNQKRITITANTGLVSIEDL